MPFKLTHGLLILAVGLLLLNIKEANLGLLLKERVCIATGMAGVILIDGKPARNLTVQRKLRWKSDDWDNITQSVTNDHGEFSFATHWEDIRIKFMTQPVFTNRIEVLNVDIEEPIIFTTSKIGLDEYSEFDGKPTNFKCELTDPWRKVKTKYGFIATNCIWELVDKED